MKHGTRSSYTYQKCRCEPCKAAARDYMRFYRGSKITSPTATSRTAWNRAVGRLIDRHSDEFRRLVDDETAREVAS